MEIRIVAQGLHLPDTYLSFTYTHQRFGCMSENHTVAKFRSLLPSPPHLMNAI